MKIWITTVGWSPFAVFNTLWFAIVRDSYIPDKIYLIWNSKVENNKEIIKKYLNALNESYGFNLKVVEYKIEREENFKEFIKGLSDIILKEKKYNNEIAIDITPGRKFMSAFSMFAGLEGV